MKLSRLSLSALVLLTAAPARAFWIDGEGNYGLRGSTETSPGFSKSSGTFQAIEQTFRLKGEARFNDQSSMYLQFRLFDNPREAYMGDTSQPADCPKGQDCSHQYQNTSEPGYKPYVPKVTEAYIRYAFDYCILDAGRRPRNWGLGIFLDSGEKPFDQTASVFDGVTCNVNLQKTQTLGFSVGYDKLSETGVPVDPDWQDSAPGTVDRRFGANDPNDDLDQYFFTIEYDDRKANAGATFTKQIGVYFAQVTGKNYSTVDKDPDPNNPGQGSLRKETGGSQTDLKFLDLYTGFYLGDLSLKNEILFRMGKSKDPSYVALGGSTGTDTPATNKLDSLAVAGGLDWTISHSGAPLGPAEFNKGDARRHVLFFNYAYAPGDGDGYLNDQAGIGDSNTAINEAATKMAKSARTGSAKAIPFNRNFKPALLLFNARPEADDLIVDGAFNPSRMMNATLFALGYRYESMETGNFEVKLVTANLNDGPPQSVKDYYAAISGTSYDKGSRPAGFFGRNLGTELDLSYTYRVGREADLGVAAAGALPGKAWQTEVDSKPANDFLIQSTATFHF